MILDGYKLSYKAFVSLKNSGAKNIFFLLKLFRSMSVKPKGIVDLITIVALSLCSILSEMTFYTDEVSKKPLTAS